MAWAEGTASVWVGGWALGLLGGCLLLCGFCRRKPSVSPTPGPQPRDSPVELGSRYVSDPTVGPSAAPRPPAGLCSTDNEDDDDFQYPPVPRTQPLHTEVVEPLKQVRESGTDVDSHGSYVNINSEEDYVNVNGAVPGSSVEKDKEYLEVLPEEAERTRPHGRKGPSHKEGECFLHECGSRGAYSPSLLELADYDYVNVP